MANPIDSAEPVPVIPLEYAKPAALPRRGWVIAANVALFLAVVDIVVGLVLIGTISAETVLATAPVLFAAGGVLMTVGWRLKLVHVGILGLAHCSICLLFTMLVNVLSWSPREAVMPFVAMGAAYLSVVAAPMTAVSLQRLRALSAASAPRDLPSAVPVAEDGR